MPKIHCPKGFAQLPIVALRNCQMSPLFLLATRLQQRERVSISIRPGSRLYEQAFHLTVQSRIFSCR